MVYTEGVYNNKAALEILPWLFSHVQTKSILDIGCGIGTWLDVASNLISVEYLGIDASPYNDQLWKIPHDNYTEVDISRRFDLNRKYDLAFCLEVAEHIPATSADTLIDSICQHTSIVLFSAAIPGQGGHAHVNEQWPTYWMEKFSEKGFKAYDIIRPVFWENRNIECWYKQNLIIYAIPGSLPTEFQPTNCVKHLVHPELFQMKLDMIIDLVQVKAETIFYPTIKFALKALIKAIFKTPFKNKK